MTDGPSQVRGFMKTKFIVAAVVIVGVVVFAVASIVNGGKPVDAVAVERGPIREFVEERGKTRLPQVYQVTMPYDARIAAIEIIEGTPVSQGQVLAQIIPADRELAVLAAKSAVERLEAMIRENDDVTVEQTSLEQARNQVESTKRTVEAARTRTEAAKAKLDMAKRTLDRMSSLRKNNVKTDEEFENAQLAHVDAALQYQQDLLQLRSLEANQAATALSPRTIEQNIARKDLTHSVLEKQMQEAQVKLTQAETDSVRGVLLSPVTGVVLERLISDEKRVMGGTVLLTVGRLEDLEVEADILSQEVVAIVPNDPVEISGPSIGQQPAMGKVQRIYPSGFTKISSLGVEQQRVKVIVHFNASELQRLIKGRAFGAEYRVRVRVFTASNEDALQVPRSAVFRSMTGDWQVYAIRDNELIVQTIKTGIFNDERVEVLEGLKQGELVVLAPESDLVANMSVKPVIRELHRAKDIFSSDD